MRKYLEEEMLADSLCGRVRYGCTVYTDMKNTCNFEIYIDGKQIKRFSWVTVWKYAEKYDEGCMYEPTLRPEYTEREFCQALNEYRNQSIQNSLESDNPMIRMFAVFDRRVGKRTLMKLKDTVALQPEWLQIFYRTRLEAENIH